MDKWSVPNSLGHIQKCLACSNIRQYRPKAEQITCIKLNIKAQSSFCSWIYCLISKINMVVYPQNCLTHFICSLFYPDLKRRVLLSRKLFWLAYQQGWNKRRKQLPYIIQGHIMYEVHMAGALAWCTWRFINKLMDKVSNYHSSVLHGTNLTHMTVISHRCMSTITGIFVTDTIPLVGLRC